MKSWIDRTETYCDKGRCMEFNQVGNTMFSVISTPSGNCLVQITAMRLYFNTDSVKMAYDVAKPILVKEK